MTPGSLDPLLQLIGEEPKKGGKNEKDYRNPYIVCISIRHGLCDSLPFRFNLHQYKTSSYSHSKQWNRNQSRHIPMYQYSQRRCYRRCQH